MRVSWPLVFCSGVRLTYNVVNLTDLTIARYFGEPTGSEQNQLDAGLDPYRSRAARASLLARSLALSRAVPGARMARPLGSVQANGDRSTLGADSTPSHHVGFHRHLRPDRAPAVRRNGTLPLNGPRRYFAVDLLLDRLERGFQQPDQ